MLANSFKNSLGEKNKPNEPNEMSGRFLINTQPKVLMRKP